MENTLNKKPEPLTMEMIKGVIAFPKDELTYKNLSGLCDVWYQMEINNGADEQSALKTTLDKLVKIMLEMGDKILTQ